MNTTKKQELLEKLWGLTIESLITLIEGGEFTSQDLNIARQVLKDHGMTVANIEESPIGDLADVLPFTQSRTNNQGLDETYG